jgi:proton-translocating NADH-quinone oxidoreductase chain L
MLLLIILFPLLGFFGGSIFGRLLGREGTSVLTVSFTGASFLLSWFIFCSIIASGSVYIVTLGQWICLDNLQVNWSFCFDSLTATMLCVVTLISTFVHLYSTSYMAQDPHLTRFMSYLSLFTFFMLILITANNFLQMFIGWEGVGVSSYLLINFWFTRVQANKAAIKAMLMNRVGDFALLLAIFTIFFIFCSLDYSIVFSLASLALNAQIIVGGFKLVILDVICVLLFMGAMGKSAQLGFHTWLPDAMEGPTPVSALIHAATMVTAGVFLVIRCSYLFEFSPLALNLVALVGSCTAFFAATTGLFQNDLKKVIAYSTCSQLGYMIFACGLSSYEVGLFHLSNHAFFKALLFLGAGSVIHALSDEQDLRKMGGLKNILPFSYAIMLIGSLALIGFPFLAGFYSKDVILELSVAKYSFEGHFSFLLGILAAFCTAFYSIRVLFLVFLSKPNGNKNVILNAHEGDWALTAPLLILSFFSIFIGFLSKDLFIGFGTDFWGSAIFVLPSNYLLTDIEFIDIKYKILPLIFTLAGAGFAFILYNYFTFAYFDLKKSAGFKVFYNFFNKKWFFDRVYTQFISQNLLTAGFNFFYQTLDRGLIEKVGPTGMVDLIYFLVKHTKNFQSGIVLNYLALFVGAFFFMALVSCSILFFHS